MPSGNLELTTMSVRSWLLAGAMLGLKGKDKVETGACSYVFQASDRFPY